MPSIAASPAWYSRATLVSAAFASPPIEVAASAIACVICAGIEPQQPCRRRPPRRRSRPAAVKAALAETRVIASLMRPAAS